MVGIGCVADLVVSLGRQTNTRIILHTLKLVAKIPIVMKTYIVGVREEYSEVLYKRKVTKPKK